MFGNNIFLNFLKRYPLKTFQKKFSKYFLTILKFFLQNKKKILQNHPFQARSGGGGKFFFFIELP